MRRKNLYEQHLMTERVLFFINLEVMQAFGLTNPPKSGTIGGVNPTGN